MGFALISPSNYQKQFAENSRTLAGISVRGFAGFLIFVYLMDEAEKRYRQNHPRTPISDTFKNGFLTPEACIGCRNYHGVDYGRSKLVCGIHPYGWDGNDCPDWEN